MYMDPFMNCEGVPAFKAGVHRLEIALKRGYWIKRRRERCTLPFVDVQPSVKS